MTTENVPCEPESPGWRRSVYWLPLESGELRVINASFARKGHEREKEQFLGLWLATFPQRIQRLHLRVTFSNEPGDGLQTRVAQPDPPAEAKPGSVGRRVRALGLNPSFATFLVCDLGQVALDLRALGFLSPSVK